MAKSKGMAWTNLFENINDTSRNTIAHKYNIHSYPTQILINPQGKIIFRSKLGPELTEVKLDSLLER